MRHVVYLTLIAAFCAGCFAQSAPPAFESASIRPSPGMDPKIQVTPGNLFLRNQTVLFMVRWAWDLPAAQVDAPSSLADSRFDVVAKAADPAGETQMRLMLQTPLAERFGLKVHKEARVMQVYAITLAKGGPKFQEAQTEGPYVLERNNPIILNAHHARMSDLVQEISAQVGRPVVDETGLKGQYEIHLDVTPYVSQASAGNNGGQLDVMGILFTGFQDLLGLKLEARKQSVDVLVVDHAEKTPTEN